MVNLDIEILRVFNQLFLSSFHLLFMLIDYSIYLYLVILVYTLLKGKKKKQLAHIFLTLIIGLFIVYSLKYSITRARPYDVYPDIKKTGQFEKTTPSFPSSHAFISFLSLHFIFKKPKWLKYFSIIYLIIIPFGSLYMAVHYPSDILIGALLGWFLPIVISEKRAYKLIKKVSTF